MRIGIYEPGWHGHRMHYVGLITEAIVRAGHDATLTTSKGAIASDEYDVHVRAAGLPLTVQASSSAAHERPATWAIRGLRQVQDLARSGTVDWILVPNADHIAQAAAAATRSSSWPVPVEGLLLRARFAYPTDRPRDRALAWASKKAVVASPWHRIMCLDPLANEALPDGQSVEIMPEPVEALTPVDEHTARNLLGLATSEAPLFVMPGTIDARKGAVEAARAFLRADLPADAALAFVGRVEPGTATELQSLGNDRITIIDRTLTDEEFAAALYAADVLLTTYRRHVGPSGILARAAEIGAPVIASDYGWVGEATRRYRLGIDVDTGDDAALRASFEDAAHRLPWDTRTEASLPYRTFNSVAAFQRAWMSGISKASH